jgi:outer membrane protein OmpA-like peptidoglycan-associated protein
LSQRHVTAALVSLIALVASADAQAQDVEPSGPPYSIDIEFIRPTFGHGSLVGVDVPMVKKPRAFRYALYGQYESNPLTLYDQVADTEIGVVVADRVGFMTGLSYDISERVTVGAMLPAAVNFNSQTPEFAADVFGVGDFGVNGRVVFLKTRRDIFNMGLRAGLILPTGRTLSYIGDQSVRVSAGLLAATNLGPVRLATDAGVITREEDNTGEDFIASSEVIWNNGVVVSLPAAMRTALTGQVMARSGMSNFLAGGAENALEAVAGVQFYPSQYTTLDFGAGRGLTEGYGTTDLRLLMGLVVEIAPKDRVVLPAPPPPPPALPPEPPPPEVVFDEPEIIEETEISVVYEDRIELKEQIEFIVNTNTIQEYSLPIVDDIARVLNSKANIGHVAIIGHASQEGSFEHNYELSESRARAIWQKLIERGVAYSRISYQGAGEVRPLAGFLTEAEADLQKNRRTEFQITQWYATPDEMPDYPADQAIPWTGTRVPVISPPKPEPEAKEEEKEVKLDEYGMPVDDEEIEIDLGKPGEEK